VNTRNIFLTLVILFSGFSSAILALDAAPEFKLRCLDGSEVSLSSYKGKIVIIDFWSIYCPPCREEIPGFVEIYQKLKDRGVEILGINLDRDDEKVKAFIEANKVDYPILFSTKEVLDAYGGGQAIPTTFILDRNLKIVKKHVAFTEKSEFEKEIYEILNQNISTVQETSTEPGAATDSSEVISNGAPPPASATE